MNTYVWMFFIVVAFFSVIPVFRLQPIHKHEKYRVLWFLSMSVATWTIVMILKFLSTHYYYIYYFHIITYPVVAAIIFFIFETIQRYTEHETPKFGKYFMIGFVVLELILVFVNPWTYAYIKLPMDPAINQVMFDESEYGIFFYIHTAICYIILLISVVRILFYIRKKTDKTVSVFPFRLIYLSVIFGIGINLINIFFYNLRIDPTYIFVVLITNVLYLIVYRKDFNMNLILTGKRFLLDNMRELYLVVDHKDNIVDFSRFIETVYKVKIYHGMSITEFKNEITKTAITFEQLSDLKGKPFVENIPYLQITKSQLNVDTFTQKGYVISIYDETENARLIHEVNELRSHDIMTGLFNRNYFEEIQKTIDYSDEKICMILFDVDGLKLRNDYLGHSEGDRLLIDFSSYLSKVIKPYKSAVGIRLGGDEFMVILRDCDEDVVEDVINHLKVLCDENQGNRRISFSYGYSIRKNKKDNILAIMKRCDLMLYEEKAKRIEYRKRLEKELKSNI